MAGMSDYMEALVLNLFRGTSITAPSAIYVALYTVAPTDAGGGTEVSGGSYGRVAVTFGAPSGGSMSNSAQVVYTKATADWGTLVAFSFMDDVSAGNMWAWNTLTESREILNKDQAIFDIGDLTATAD